MIACQFTNSAAFEIPSSFTYDTEVPLDLECFCTGFERPSPTGIRVMQTGVYVVAFNAQWAETAFQAGIACKLFCDGEGSAAAAANQPAIGNAYAPILAFTCVKTLKAGTVVSFKVAQSSGSVKHAGPQDCDGFLALLGLTL